MTVGESSFVHVEGDPGSSWTAIPMGRSSCVEASTHEAMVAHEVELIEDRYVAKLQIPRGNDVIQLVEGACRIAPGPLSGCPFLEESVPDTQGV
jgi:hypothetical protein